jgi:hypothetical protein
MNVKIDYIICICTEVLEYRENVQVFLEKENDIIIVRKEGCCINGEKFYFFNGVYKNIECKLQDIPNIEKTFVIKK